MFYKFIPNFVEKSPKVHNEIFLSIIIRARRPKSIKNSYKSLRWTSYDIREGRGHRCFW